MLWADVDSRCHPEPRSSKETHTKTRQLKKHQTFHPATYLLAKFDKVLLEINQLKRCVEKEVPQEISDQHLLISKCLRYPLRQQLEIW